MEQQLDKQGALRLLTLFSGAVKGMAFYPESHPAIRQPLLELDRALGAVLARTRQVSWGIIDGIMFLDEHLLISPTTAIADLTNRMQERGIGRVIVQSGTSFGELQGFVALLAGRSPSFEHLAASMLSNGITHITLIRLGEESHAPGGASPAAAEGEGDAGMVYGRALDAVRRICRDIERGRIPASEPVISVVDRMVELTMQEPSTLIGLTMIKDYDNYTFNHCVNVGVLAMALGATLGLGAQDVKRLGISGHLHDIGKTMIPREILNKPGRLSSDEYNEMKRHSELGAKIVREMEGLGQDISQIVLGHHLHYNRDGYPEWARHLPFNRMVDIIAIADTYDAITTLRVYQHPVNPRAALTEMQSLGGTMLDGELVELFSGMMGKYPVGSLVRLDTNEVAVVYRPNPLDQDFPVVRVLIDAGGKRLTAPRERMLLNKDGARYASIVALVDPVLKNINVGRFVADGAY